jgi:Holliday junction resolvase RusA-like endonuclease
VVTVVTFTVIGKPVGKGSKRAVPIRRKNGRTGIAVLEPEHVRAFEDTLRVEAANAARQVELEGLLDQPVRVTLIFRFQRPRSHYRTGRHAGELRDGAPSMHAVKPDADKLARTALDALTGTILQDDSRVALLQVSKVYARPPWTHEGVEAEVKTMGVPPEGGNAP